MSAPLAALQRSLQAPGGGHRPPRRVGSWIDEDEFLPDDRPTLRLPAPGGALQALHDTACVQRLAAVLDARLRVAIERPLVVHPRACGNGHAMLVLFGAVVEVHRQRVERASLVALEPANARWHEQALPPATQEIGDDDFSVWPSPFGAAWMERYLHGVAHWLLLPPLHFDKGIALDYVRWLGRQMLRRHWGRCSADAREPVSRPATA